MADTTSTTTTTTTKSNDLKPATLKQVWNDIKIPAMIAGGIIILSYVYVHLQYKRH